MKEVLVLLDTAPAQRKALAKRIGGRAKVHYFQDLTPEELEAVLPRVHVVLCAGMRGKLTSEEIRSMASLELVQTLLAGGDHLPFEDIPERAAVCGASGANSKALAEHVFGLLLAAAKQVVPGTDNIREGVWDRSLRCRALEKGTLAVLGLGNIGGEVVRLGRAFRMRVYGVNRSGESVLDCDYVGTLEELDSILREADYVVITLPLTVQTRGLIDGRALGKMKPDAVLVNISRGGLVVERDLYEHLRDHPSFVAATDVWWTYPEGREGRPFSARFEALPNFIGTPHIGYSTPGHRERTMDAMMENVERYLEGRPVRNVLPRYDYVG